MEFRRVLFRSAKSKRQTQPQSPQKTCQSRPGLPRNTRHSTTTVNLKRFPWAGRYRKPIFGCQFARDRSRSFSSVDQRSEEHTSELQSLMRISYAVFCLKKKK